MASRISNAGRDRLIFFNFDRNPAPINTTTLTPTSLIAEPRSNHPFHIKTQRRMQAFDPEKLHWSVRAPTDLSRSAFIRKYPAHRMRDAFKDELRKAGWDSEGKRRAEGGEDGVVKGYDLKGALRLGLTKDPFALTASGEEVRESAKWAVEKLVALQYGAGGGPKRGGQQRPGSFQGNRGRGDRSERAAREAPTPIRKVTHR